MGSGVGEGPGLGVGVLVAVGMGVGVAQTQGSHDPQDPVHSVGILGEIQVSERTQEPWPTGG